MAGFGLVSSLIADLVNRGMQLKASRDNAKEWNAQQRQNKEINDYNAGRASAIEQNLGFGSVPDYTQAAQTQNKDEEEERRRFNQAPGADALSDFDNMIGKW